MNNRHLPSSAFSLLTLLPPALLAVLSLLCLPRADAAIVGGQPVWTNRYNGIGDGRDEARAIAVDRSGNVLVAGLSTGSRGYDDYATIAYSGGGMPLWTNRYSEPRNGGNWATAVAVDRSGNVFVTGFSPGISSMYDYATVAYSGTGVPLWTNRYDRPGAFYARDYAYAVAVDRSGNVFVTGTSQADSSGSRYTTIAYSGAGVPIWTNHYSTESGNQTNSSFAVAVDSSGNVFVTGMSFNSAGNSDYATIAYSGAGVPLWTNRYNGPPDRDDRATAVAVDSNGNVFVTGWSIGFSGRYDYATIAYTGAGVPLWTQRYNGPGNSDDYASDVAVDRNGNVFVTGYSYGSAGNLDYATIAYSGAGVPLWTNRYNGPGNSDDFAMAVAVDSNRNVFVTGQSYGGATGVDYATIAYSGAGVPLWTNHYNGPGNTSDYPLAMALDSSGNVFVTGSSGGDYLTIKYAALPPSPVLTSFTRLGDGSCQFGFTNLSGYSFTALATTNVSLDASNWTVLGPVPEIAPGQFQFTDSAATNFLQRFYRIRSP